MALLIVGGCATPPDDLPRDRLGAMPFPGLLTLYHAADPANLGEHQYDRRTRRVGAEEERGIIYTTRAGFLDLAHIRITVDTVRYCAGHIRRALEERQDVVALSTIEGSIFHVAFHYPPHWPAVLDDEYAVRVADELAIRIGQRLAYMMMTWHELITWFGYRSLPFFDEAPSAFTYDDPMSHLVGLMVAGRVLRRQGPDPFDDAVTHALSAELAALGAVSPRQTDEAVRAVDGIWWRRGAPLKRQIDVGLADGAVRPWLVPSVDPARYRAPELFRVPTLANIYGQDLSSFYSVTIDPRIPVAHRIREILPSRPSALLSADRDFPQLLRAIRRQMQEQFAVDVDQPWPSGKPPRTSSGGQILLMARDVTSP
jgi:hypothetical protein